MKFYDQMNFNLAQRLGITKRIIELTDPSEARTSLRADHKEVTSLKMVKWYSMIIINEIFPVTTVVHCTYQQAFGKSSWRERWLI